MTLWSGTGSQQKCDPVHTIYRNRHGVLEGINRFLAYFLWGHHQYHGPGGEETHPKPVKSPWILPLGGPAEGRPGERHK